MLEFLLIEGALKFGDFTLKSGRKSPYFIDLASVMTTGSKLRRVISFYKAALLQASVFKELMMEQQQHTTRSDDTSSTQPSVVLFGPPYKGITLASSLAYALDAEDIDARNANRVAFMYNRKEAKDHGEGGMFVGYPYLSTNCMTPIILVDDVLTAGTAVTTSLNLLQDQAVQVDGTKGGRTLPILALLVAMDRQERPKDVAKVASRHLRDTHGIEVIAIFTLSDLILYLEDLVRATSPLSTPLQAVKSWLLENDGISRLKHHRDSC